MALTQDSRRISFQQMECGEISMVIGNRFDGENHVFSLEEFSRFLGEAAIAMRDGYIYEQQS